MKFSAVSGLSPFHDKEYDVKLYLLAVGLLIIPACSESKDSDDAPKAGNPASIVTPAATSSYETRHLTVDATQKSIWVYHGLRDGELVPMTQKENWIIGISRYMWQTNTGSSGPFEGGAYEVKDQSFEAMDSCDAQRFVKDIMVPPLGSVHEGITSNWWNIADPVPTPLDTSFIIGRDTECIKLKILSYDKGLYALKFQRIK